MEVTIIDDRYITFQGSKYRRLKGRTVQVRRLQDNPKRAQYMREYRKKKKDLRGSEESAVAIEIK